MLRVRRSALDRHKGDPERKTGVSGDPLEFPIANPHEVEGWTVLLCFLETNGWRALYKMPLDIPHPGGKWRHPAAYILACALEMHNLSLCVKRKVNFSKQIGIPRSNFPTPKMARFGCDSFPLMKQSVSVP